MSEISGATRKPLPTAEDVERANKEVIARLTERFQPIATALIQLELEAHIIRVRMKSLLAQVHEQRRSLPAGVSGCYTCGAIGESPWTEVYDERTYPEKRAVTRVCSKCGSQPWSWWEEQLGITAARKVL